MHPRQADDVRTLRGFGRLAEHLRVALYGDISFYLHGQNRPTHLYIVRFHDIALSLQASS